MKTLTTEKDRTAVISERTARKASTVYDNVTWQFNQAADLMKLSQSVRKILSTTTNEVVVHFPVRMDNGRIEMFTRLPGSAQ